MTSRERVLKAINFQVPDRPPVFATITPQVAEKVSAYLNIPYEPPLDSLLSSRISHTKLLTALGNDCVCVGACTSDSSPSKTLADGTIVNEWGMHFKNVGLYNEFSKFPLEHARTVADIESYDFPDPFGQGRFDEATAAIKKYKKTHAIVADLETSIFETAWYLVGLEKLLMDMANQEPYVEALFDKVMEINVEIGKKLVELGADIVWAGDDFGSQQGMIMSPEAWRRIFKPRIKTMIQEFKSVNPDVKVAWHSCGSIFPIIPDFVEIGLDILNPLQPLAKDMDPELLKRTFGKDLVLFGGIDIQELFPYAAPEEIKNNVRKMAAVVGENGGYIIAPAHNIQDDTPVENILAFFDAVKELAQE